VVVGVVVGGLPLSLSLRIGLWFPHRNDVHGHE